MSAPLRLAITLHYLASGAEFSALAPSYRLAESTTRALVYICCAIVNVRGAVYLPEPTEETSRASERKFRERWLFSNRFYTLTESQVGIIQRFSHLLYTLKCCERFDWARLLLADTGDAGTDRSRDGAGPSAGLGAGAACRGAGPGDRAGAPAVCGSAGASSSRKTRVS